MDLRVVDDELIHDLNAKKEEHTKFIVPADRLNFPHMSDGRNPRPLDTIENVEWLLEYFGISLKYNLMSRNTEIVIPDFSYLTDQMANVYLQKIQNVCLLNGLSKKTIKDHLQYISWQRPYHPIRECIKKRPWDKQPRLEKFIDTIKSTNPEYTKKIIYTWLISAIEAAYSDIGFAAQGVLILQGKQGIGKTCWVKQLDPINCNAVKEGALLDPTNKDNVTLLSRFWIVELGEIDATFRKSDVARLKSFITTQIDSVRLPYAPEFSTFPRRSVYVATVNESNFLVDETGNRRWWTIEVLDIELKHQLDIQQIWAEAKHHWENGASPYLNVELQEQVNNVNKDHEKLNPIKEKIMNGYDWAADRTRLLTATEVLGEIGYYKPTVQETTIAGMALSELTGDTSFRTKKGRFHKVPPRLVNI